MAEMLVQSESLTSIADKIRVLKDIAEPMSLSDMETELDNIPKNNSDDLTVSGAIVTVPAGYYASQTAKSVETATQATPSITVDASGLITASATQTAGYVDAGTESVTKQLDTQGAKTVTPSSVQQTAISAGTFASGTVTVAAIPSDYKQIISTSGEPTFTSTSSATGKTVTLGFKPDFLTITEKTTLYDEEMGKTFRLDSSFNFIVGGDNIDSVSWTSNGDRAYELFVRRMDDGFQVSAWRYNSDFTSASWWGNKTFYYYAYKIT